MTLPNPLLLWTGSKHRAITKKIQAEVEPTKARFLLPAVAETRPVAKSPTNESPGNVKRGLLVNLFGR